MANHTPESFALDMLARANEVPKAAQRGMRNALLAVDREAAKNLSGTGDPGSYPVPLRSGNLRRSGGVRRIGDLAGVVFNRARYARAIHEGFQPYGNKNARRKTGRPWLELAVGAVDFLGHIARPVRRALKL